MRLTEIKIENYKSVTAPVSVRFQKDLPVVLIGKNGSGKSNILEALEHIFSANAKQRRSTGSEGICFRAFMCLDKDEFALLFPNEKYSETKASFAVYPSAPHSLYIDTLESEYIGPLLKQEFEDVRCVADELGKAIEEYECMLEEIACDDSNELPLRSYILKDGKGSMTDYENIKFLSSRYLKQIKDLVNSYSTELTGNTFVFTDWYHGKGIYFPPHEDLIPFKLSYKAPALAPFEEKYISIDFEAIKREIDDINRRTEDACRKINELLSILKQQAERLMFGTDTCGVITGLIRSVEAVFHENCAYLISENSSDLFKDLHRENEARYYSSKIIFEAYAKATGKTELVETGERRMNDSELEEFENWLNDDRPDFDHGMYKYITVELNDKNEPEIRLLENSGEVVSLDRTSAGRRWYFTYFFVKNTLRSGDTFIIDEPAVTLHPGAQKEVLQDFLALSKSGIRVIYSTHSPYLIPEEWGCVGFVSMENGTIITNIDSASEEFRQFRAASPIDVFWYQEVSEYFRKSDFKTMITKVICGKLINKFSTHGEIAKVLGVTERTVYNWQSGKKEISINNVLTAAALLESDPLTLIKQAEN